MKDAIPIARDIMTSKVMTLRPNMPVHDAAKVLLKHGILSAPVVGEDGRFVGVFSQQGCMTALIAAAHDQVPTTFQVEAFLESGAPTVNEETELISIAGVFVQTKGAIHSLPVLREEKVVGVVSRFDVIRATVEYLGGDTSTELGQLGSLGDFERSQS